MTRKDTTIITSRSNEGATSWLWLWCRLVGLVAWWNETWMNKRRYVTNLYQFRNVWDDKESRKRKMNTYLQWMPFTIHFLQVRLCYVYDDMLTIRLKTCGICYGRPFIIVSRLFAFISNYKISIYIGKEPIQLIEHNNYVMLRHIFIPPYSSSINSHKS